MSTVLKSVDGGSSWQQISNIKSFNMAATQDNKLFLVGSDPIIYRSPDGGNSFSSIYSFGGSPYDIYFADNQSGACITEDSILLTIDGGINWTKISGLPKNDSLQNNLHCIYMRSNNIWIAYGKYIYHTNGGFTNWRLDSFPPVVENLGLTSLSAPTSTTVFASSYSGYFFKSENGGNSFSLIKKLTTGNVASPSDILFINESVGYLSLGSRIYKTTDGGNNWIVVVALGNTSVTEIHFIDEQHGWGICRDGSILKFN